MLPSVRSVRMLHGASSAALASFLKMATATLARGFAQIAAQKTSAWHSTTPMGLSSSPSTGVLYWQPAIWLVWSAPPATLKSVAPATPATSSPRDCTACPALSIHSAPPAGKPPLLPVSPASLATSSTGLSVSLASTPARVVPTRPARHVRPVLLNMSSLLLGPASTW